MTAASASLPISRMPTMDPLLPHRRTSLDATAPRKGEQAEGTGHWAGQGEEGSSRLLQAMDHEAAALTCVAWWWRIDRKDKAIW